VTSTALRFGVLASVLGLWVLSLALPALAVRGGPEATGWRLLLEGWKAVDGGVFAWFANPAFVVALILASASRWRSAAVMAGLGVAFALSSFATEQILSAGGAATPPLDLRVGFALWLAAQILLLGWTIGQVYLQPRNGLRT
jgi:hypothetical protein